MPTTFYTCSFIATSSEALKELQTQFASVTNDIPGVPNRKVEVVPDAPTSFSKLGFYFLTRNEYLQLDRNQGIQNKQLIMSPETREIETFIDSGSGSYLSLEESVDLGKFSGNDNTITTESVAFHLAYHSDPIINNLYSGSGASFTKTKYFTDNATHNPTKNNYVLDGTGVDFINCEFTNHLHPEFFDKNGNSRVQYVNWYELTGQPERAAEQPVNLYRNSSAGSDVLLANRNTHGTMTTSLAAGVVNGFAKNAKIYILPTAISTCVGVTTSGLFTCNEALDLIKRFHLSKSIDPNTGYKRPTVVNMSLAWDTTPNSLVYTHPSREESAALRGPTSTSFDLSLDVNEGIRFEYGNHHYVFISSSTTSSFGINFDSVTINSDFQGTRGYYQGKTFTGSLSNMVETINAFIPGDIPSQTLIFSSSFLSCSISGNTLSVTSSFTDHISPQLGTVQRYPVFIYTASGDSAFDPTVTSDTIVPGAPPTLLVNGFLPPQNLPFFNNGGYKTGHLAATLGKPTSFTNHVNSIIVNGQEQVTQSNPSFLFGIPFPDNDNYLNNKHYAPEGACFDLFGNVIGSIQKRELDPHNPNGYLDMHQKFGPTLDVYSPLLDELFQEVAEAGVVIVKAAGNRKTYISQTSSSFHTFFDPDRYSSVLADNHLTYDVDRGEDFLLAGEPLYYNRVQPSNGSVISVGNGPNPTSNNAAYKLTNSNGGGLGTGLIPVGNTGPAVDVYSPGRGNLHACGKNDLSKQIDTHKFFDNITFDTASVLTTISESFNNLFNNSTFFFTESSEAFHNDSSGTSAASPQIAGLVCCFLQMNPWANVRDVRNWFKTNPSLMANAGESSVTNPLYKKFIDIDITGSRTNLTIADSGSVQLGPNASQHIAHFTSTGPNPVEISGSFKAQSLGARLQN